MDGLASTVDVRDMVCAQALALVARAAARVPRGEALLVRYNAEDVKQDVIVWSKEQDYFMVEMGARILSIERRSASIG